MPNVEVTDPVKLEMYSHLDKLLGQPLPTFQSAMQGIRDWNPAQEWNQNVQNALLGAGNIVKNIGHAVTNPIDQLRNLRAPTPEELAMAFNPGHMPNAGVAGVIKHGGGNWIDKSMFGVDQNVNYLKRYLRFNEDPATMEHKLRTIGGAGDAEVQNAHNALKINDWIDKKLKPYVRNQMGTPNDPIRAQADKDKILHMPLNERLARVEGREKTIREQHGFPREGVATSDLGKQWEYLTDNAIYPSNLANLNNPLYYNNPESILKLDPSTIINRIKDNVSFGKLGFDHMIDVLGEKMNTGEITHKDLDKMSVVDAVKRAHEYNEKVAAEMAKAERESLQYANIAHKTDDGVVVKLDKPGQFAKEADNVGHSVRGYEPQENHPDWIKASGNKGQSGYGHGGWKAIKSGKAEVYSVRDFDNKPHATIEVLNKPATQSGFLINHNIDSISNYLSYGENMTNVEQNRLGLNEHAHELLDKIEGFKNQLEYVVNNPKEFQPELVEFSKNYYDNRLGKPNITQIKGPVNKDVSYKPAQTLKDFLNSRKWGTVNEIEKANLIDLENPQSVKDSLYDVLGDYKLPHERQEAFRDATAANPDVQRFMNRQEFKDFVNPPKPTPTPITPEQYDANLANFLKNSKEKGDWYHGTASDVTEFKPELGLEKPNQAGAAFFSKAPEYSGDKYAVDAPIYMAKEAHKYLTPEQMSLAQENAKQYFRDTYPDMPEHADSMIKSIEEGKPVGEAEDQLIAEYQKHLPSGPNVMKVHLNVENPFDPAVPEHVQALKDFNPNLDPKLTNRIGVTAVLEHPDIQEAIKGSGFDSFYTNEDGYRNIGVFDPTRIKSAIGNEGTFDPTNPVITKKDGGSVTVEDPVLIERRLKLMGLI